MKELSKLFAAAALTLGMAQAASAEEVIRIGYQLPLTGATAQYGQDFQRAAEMQLAKFNEAGVIPAKVEIVYEDSRSDAKEGVAIARRFVDDDEIVGVLGDFTSTVSMAAAQVYSREGMVQLSQTASHPEYAGISDYQFRNIATSAQESAYNADWMNEIGYKNVAIIAEQTDWGQSVSGAFSSSFEENGGEIVFSEFYNRGLADFRSVIAKIERSNPDAIFIGSFYEDAAQFLKQAKQLGVSVPIHAAGPAYNQQLLDLAGDAANGLKISAGFLPISEQAEVQAFVEAWKADTGEIPGQFPAQAFDAVGIMLDAVAAAYPDITRDSLRDAVAATADYPGVTGMTTFNDSGDAEKFLARVTVSDGEFVAVK